jgi:hypothetical protein
MRAKTKAVSVALCALFLFAFAANVQAQNVIHFVTQQNNEVVQYGLTELMGEIKFQSQLLRTTQSNTITVTYQGSQIANIPSGFPTITLPTPTSKTISYSNGITLDLTCNAGNTVGYCGEVAPGVFNVAISGINTALGGQIILAIANLVEVQQGDEIRINGVRSDVSTKSIGQTVNATITSTPSNANTFDSVSLTVATVNQSMTVVVTGRTIPICTSATNPVFKVIEGFAGAFVEYTTPGFSRPRYGATGDTRVRIQVNNLPANVTLSWPTTVTGTTEQGNGTSPATLVLESGSTSSVAIYTYNTTDQGTSDQLKESFAVIPVVTVPATAGFGTATAQGQLWPDATSTTIIRFAHPLINNPADNFLTISKCVTYLLFPFTTGNNIPGFTTGLAIANTSADDAAFGTGLGATPQSGAITLYGWHNSVKAADGSSTTTFAPATFTGAPVTAVVSTNLTAGDTWTGVVDGATGFSGFQGYIIAKCDFQFAHGFSFIVGKYNSGTVFDVAHGYLALVIPDPAITARVTTAGESLGQ